jgi:hypothetical protein
MRHLLILSLMCTVGCIPKRDLPDWRVAQMQNRANNLAPCGSFSRGQRLGRGITVLSVRAGHVYVKMADGGTFAIPCR